MSNMLTKLLRRVAFVVSSLIVLSSLSVAPQAGAAASYPLSDGCMANARGVSECKTLIGATYGSNSDPTAWEKELGQNLGVRRTFWRPDQVDGAVKTANVDVAAGRIPWMSFKLPHKWADMASGKGDAWAKGLAAKFAKVNGPVWIAFHHEPEGDESNIKLWTKTQERLGPILRKGAPNAAFTVILTGWNQLYGPAEFRLDNVWPDTTVDIAGFDVYSFYNTYKNGKLRLGEAYLKEQYFEPISEWAKSKGVAWGLAETGLTNRAHKDYPEWIRQTAQDMRDTGGVALAYFNTTLNNSDNYHIATDAKTDDFRAALKSKSKSPSLSPSTSPSTSVSVAGVEFVAVGSSSGNRTQHVVRIPAEVEAGDLLVMLLTLNSVTTASAPAGWTVVEESDGNGFSARVWTKVASAEDVGVDVSVTTSRWLKSAMSVAAYRSSTGEVEVASVVTAGPVNGAGSVLVPEVELGGGSLVVSYVGVKNSGDVTVVLPAAGLESRSVVVGSGSGAAHSVLSDTGQYVSGGSFVGGEATFSTSVNRAIAYTLALKAS